MSSVEDGTDTQHDPLVGYRTEALLFEALLGHGAMGAVYRGRQLRLDRVVAIKVIAGHLTANAGYVERFTREARTLARLAHPHVVTCHDFGPIPGPEGRQLQVLVMEYVDGESLGDKVVTTQSVRGVLELYRQVATGLAAAHALGIVHRDIKPDNVMVTRGGQAKLADFGLAKPQASSGLTADGSVLGSPAYMAPEVCRGSEPTAASDMYSVGCALFQSLSGLTPFTATTALEVIQQHITQPPPPLSRRVPTLAHLDALVARLLDKDPARRPTAAELVPLLDQVRERIPVDLRLTSGEIDTGRAERAAMATMAEPLASPDATHATAAPGATLAASTVTVALAQMPAAVSVAAAPGPAAASAAAAPIPDYLQPLPDAPTGPITLARPASVPAPVPPSTPTSPPVPPADDPNPPPARVPAATAARAAPQKDSAAAQAVHAAAHERRIGQAKAFEEQGDAHAAAQRWREAVACYTQAAQQCGPGAAYQALQAKMAAIVHRRRRRAWMGMSAAAVVLAAGAVGVGVAMQPATPALAQAPTPGAPAADPAPAPSSSAAVTTLRDLAQDPMRDPHPLLEQAIGLARGARHDAQLAALVTQLQARVAAIDADLAVITQDRWHDPQHALIAAAHLRTLAPGAPWLLTRLPLAGRIEITGAASAQVQLTVDGTSQPPGVCDFCRTPGRETAVVVAAPGYETASVTVSPARPEASVPVRLAEAARWTAHMPLAEWARLQVVNDRLVISDSHGVRLVDLRTGRSTGHLDAAQLGSHARGFLQPPAGQDLGLPLHLAADDGNRWTIPVPREAFGTPTRVVPGPVTPVWTDQTFELHLGETGAILALPGAAEEDEGRVEAMIGDHVLWTLPCTGHGMPGLIGLDRGALVVDAQRARLLDQEGQEQAQVALPAPRIGPPVWLADTQVVAVPTTGGIAAVQVVGTSLATFVMPVTPCNLLAGDGHHRLLAATGTSITLLDTRPGASGWEHPLQAAVQGLSLGAGAAVVTLADTCLVLGAHDGRLLRRLALPGPPLGPAIAAGTTAYVVAADGVRAYDDAVPMPTTR